MATVDADGYVTLVGADQGDDQPGRHERLPAGAGESILAEHPGILEAAVVGLPDDILGEVPCLCVIARGAARVSLDEVREFLAARGLARYKFPVRVEVFADFPRGQTMRVDRRRLAERAIARTGG